MGCSAYSGGCEVAFTSARGCEEVNVKGMSQFSLSVSSVHLLALFLRDSAMFWWRASSQENHFQRENMGILAQGKPYVVTAFIFLGFFLLWP